MEKKKVTHRTHSKSSNKNGIPHLFVNQTGTKWRCLSGPSGKRWLTMTRFWMFFVKSAKTSRIPGQMVKQQLDNAWPICLAHAGAAPSNVESQWKVEQHELNCSSNSAALENQRRKTVPSFHQLSRFRVSLFFGDYLVQVWHWLMLHVRLLIDHAMNYAEVTPGNILSVGAKHQLIFDLRPNTESVISNVVFSVMVQPTNTASVVVSVTLSLICLKHLEINGKRRYGKVLNTYRICLDGLPCGLRKLTRWTQRLQSKTEYIGKLPQ